MKLNPNSTQQPISDLMTEEGYADYAICQSKRFWEHPWNKHMREWDAEEELEKRLKKPNPPTPEAVEKSKFKDKTYKWNGR